MPHATAKTQCTAFPRGLWWVVLLALSPVACNARLNEQVLFYNHDGIRLFQQGKVQEAKETFEVALALKPKDVNLAFNLGRCYDRLGNPAKAEELFTQCLE